MKRAQVLASHALTADLGRAMLACTSARRCRLPYCSRCRMDRNDRTRAEASDQFRNPAACLAVTANVCALPLSDTQGLQDALGRERGRLRTALNKFGPVRLLGAFELVLKHKSEVDPKCYPVRGKADWYLLLHWHGLVEADLDEFKAFMAQTYKLDRYSGHRVQAKALIRDDQTEVMNWAGYAFKVSTTKGSGLESDLALPLIDSLLPQYVHAYEAIRGRGLNGVRLSYGLRNSSKIIDGDDPKRMDQSVDTVPDVFSVVQDQVHSKSNMSFPNCGPEAKPIVDSSSSTYAESSRTKIRLSVSSGPNIASMKGHVRPPEITPDKRLARLRARLFSASKQKTPARISPGSIEGHPIN